MNALRTTCSRKLESYPSENISLICKDYKAAHDELQAASQYDNNLTMVMLKEIMKAGGYLGNILRVDSSNP